MAHAQALTAAAVFKTPATQPAWKSKPSWYAVAKADRIINPDLERMYAKRAHSQTIEVAGGADRGGGKPRIGREIMRPRAGA
jgi:hypothetical protein